LVVGSLIALIGRPPFCLGKELKLACKHATHALVHAPVVLHFAPHFWDLEVAAGFDLTAGGRKERWSFSNLGEAGNRALR
jgi:hypothetical protein